MNKRQYAAYLKSDEWRSTRHRKIDNDAQIDERERIQCDRCKLFVPRRKIDVHHKTYERLGAEKDWDLEILCECCHAEEHGKPVPGWRDRLLNGTSLDVPALGEYGAN